MKRLLALLPALAFAMVFFAAPADLFPRIYRELEILLRRKNEEETQRRRRIRR